MASTKTIILKQIKKNFKKLYNKHGEPTVHKLGSFTSDDCKSDLDKYGMFFVDIYDDFIYQYNLLHISRELFCIIFDVYLPLDTSIDVLLNYDQVDFQEELKRIKLKYDGIFRYDEEFLVATLSSFWNSSKGFGNSNFKFVYLQFLKDDPKFEIDGIDKEIEFNYNPIHRLNLRLLWYYPDLWNLFKSLYPDTNPMVSWDSQKVRFQDTGKINKIGVTKLKPTKADMTKRHHDIYTYGGKDMDRIQSMIIMQDKEAIALGYVLFSNNNKIRKLIANYFGKENLNFGTVEDPELNKIIDKYWRAPLHGFVIWNQPTIHYEGLPINDGFLRKFGGMKETPESLRSFSFRAVIGTHTPIELSQQALREICFLSEQGWLPEIYKNKHNNDGTPIIKNLVNAKTTQWSIPRTMTNNEKDLLELINRNYNKETIDRYVDSLDPVIREMYGIYN
jgi:hypothetical protein